MDNMTKKDPKQTTSVIQMAPAVPPLAREKTVKTRENSHVRPSTMTYPTMEKNRKRRFSSALGWISSAEGHFAVGMRELRETYLAFYPTVSYHVDL
jgi:hypothetical protein